MANKKKKLKAVVNDVPPVDFTPPVECPPEDLPLEDYTTGEPWPAEPLLEESPEEERPADEPLPSESLPDEPAGDEPPGDAPLDLASGDEPLLSPYTSPSFRMYFRNKIPFFVPRDLLLPYATRMIPTPTTLPEENFHEIHMEEIPDDAGHVVVHYLYTGTWQTLRQRHSQHEPNAFSDANISVRKSDFETSVHVYCAARAYGLKGLVELAKEEVRELARHLTQLDVVVSASEACQLLAEDDIWFRSFLQRRLKLMFRTSKDLDDSMFMGCVQHGTVFSDFLMRGMFLLCRQNARSCRGLRAADEDQSVSEADEAILNGWETAAVVPEEGHLISASQAEPLAEEMSVPETPPLDDCAVAEQPTSEESAEPARSPAGWTEPAPEPVPQSPWDFTWSIQPKPRKKKEEKSVEENSVDGPGLVETTVTSPIPEKKKKKKSKKQEILPDVQKPGSGTEMDAEASRVTAQDPWDWTGLVKKKKKKPESGTELDAETTRATAEDSWGWGAPLRQKKAKPKTEQGITPGLDCPDRVTHILDGGWKECSTCREQVHNIAGEYRATQLEEVKPLLF